MLTSVGTMAMPCAAKASMLSGTSPVACSMQSVPAAAKSWRLCSPKQWAVTRAPSSWAAATASVSTSGGQHGVRSPASRSIQSPTSLTQPSPARASARTWSTRPSGSTSQAKPRMYRRVRAMCRPARTIFGRSARSSTQRVSEGEPASRMSRVPASRSVVAWASAVAASVAPVATSPTWQCASTRPGSTQPAQRRHVVVADRPVEGRAARRPPRPRAAPPRGRRGGVR